MEHIAAKTLPAAKGGFGVMDKGTRWNLAEVDAALNTARDIK